MSMDMTFRSALDESGVSWPAIPSVRGAQLLALLYQMESSQRWSPDRVLAAQQSQFESLFAHARKNSDFYAERFSEYSSPPSLTSDPWARIPLLTRTEVLARASDLQCKEVPRTHGRLHTTKSSGSTGQPVVVKRTEITHLLWQALALREHVWHGRDPSLPTAIIRAMGPSAPGPHGKKALGWGKPFDLVWRCGPAYLLDITVDVVEQAKWLRARQPAYFLTHPSNLDALLSQPAMKDVPLKQVLCIGETVTDRLRKRVADLLNAEVIANYSSQEIGYLAIHCPDCNQYHVQSESVFLEVLNDDGLPCAQGQVGRVVVTDLHNFAMPLIRYEIGDYAEVGDSCATRPGLFSLRHVLGRQRNMVIYPDGRKSWPIVGFAQYNHVAPIRQFQLVQRSREEIEVRLVADTKLTPTHFEGLTKVIQKSMGHPFRLNFQQWDGPLPKTKGGKFEEFVCLVN